MADETGGPARAGGEPGGRARRAPSPRRAAAQTVRYVDAAAGGGSTTYAVAIILLVVGYAMVYAGLATLRGKRVNLFAALGQPVTELPKG